MLDFDFLWRIADLWRHKFVAMISRIDDVINQQLAIVGQNQGNNWTKLSRRKRSKNKIWAILRQFLEKNEINHFS